MTESQQAMTVQQEAWCFFCKRRVVGSRKRIRHHVQICVFQRARRAGVR